MATVANTSACVHSPSVTYFAPNDPEERVDPAELDAWYAERDDVQVTDEDLIAMYNSLQRGDCPRCGGLGTVSDGRCGQCGAVKAHIAERRVSCASRGRFVAEVKRGGRWVKVGTFRSEADAWSAADRAAASTAA